MDATNLSLGSLISSASSDEFQSELDLNNAMVLSHDRDISLDQESELSSMNYERSKNCSYSFPDETESTSHLTFSKPIGHCKEERTNENGSHSQNINTGNPNCMNPSEDSGELPLYKIIRTMFEQITEKYKTPEKQEENNHFPWLKLEAGNELNYPPLNDSCKAHAYNYSNISRSISIRFPSNKPLVTITECSNESASDSRLQVFSDWTQNDFSGVKNFDTRRSQDQSTEDEGIFINYDHKGDNTEVSSPDNNSHVAQTESQVDLSDAEQEEEYFDSITGIESYPSTLEESAGLNSFTTDLEMEDDKENTCTRFKCMDDSINVYKKQQMNKKEYDEESSLDDSIESRRSSVSFSLTDTPSFSNSPARACDKQNDTAIIKNSNVSKTKGGKKRRSLSWQEGDSCYTESECTKNVENDHFKFRSPMSVKGISTKTNRQWKNYSPMRLIGSNPQISVTPTKPVRYLKNYFTEIINKNKRGKSPVVHKRVKKSMKPFLIVNPATPEPPYNQDRNTDIFHKESRTGSK